MNKIYKVLWNEAKHACVVVSELAKNHGKKSESKLAVLTLAAAVTMSGLGGAVALANSDTKGADKGAGSTVYGPYSVVNSNFAYRKL